MKIEENQLGLSDNRGVSCNFAFFFPGFPIEPIDFRRIEIFPLDV